MVIASDGMLAITDDDVVDGKLKIDLDISYIKSIFNNPYHAWKSCMSVKEIEILSPITSLDSDAFKNCHEVEKIILPDTLESLPDLLFSELEKLKTVELPKELKDMGAFTFNSCVNLERVHVPNGVSVIKRSTFRKCKSLKEVMLPNSITSIEAAAFDYCLRLKTITLPDSILSIGSSAFSNCGIESINLPSKITCVEQFTFSHCLDLKHINIHKNIKSILSNAFWNSGLESITFEEGIESIEYDAFRYCNLLKSIEFPNSLTHIQGDAFNSCMRLENVKFGNGLKVIEAKAFASCISIQEIILPNSLITLGNGVFNECSKLKKVRLSNNLKNIKKYTFKGCKYLNECEIPGSVEVIEYQAFCGCSSLKKVKFNEGIKKIEEAVFKMCEELSKINFPDSLEKIDQYAFCECTSLQSVVLPKNLKKLEATTFAWCSNLKEIEFNEKLEVISSCAFLHCSMLEKLVLPQSVKDVAIDAFSVCDKLSKINLYSTIKMSFDYAKRDVEFIVCDPKSLQTRNVLLDENSEIVRSDKFLFINDYGDIKFFDLEGNWVELDSEFVRKNLPISESWYVRGYEWLKKGKFLPSQEVIIGMPVSDIDKFYINGNYKKWKTLVESIKVEGMDKIALFKLCYVMGLFNKAGNISEKAFNFIKRHPLHSSAYHVLFYELDVEKYGYNSDFVDLILKTQSEYDSDYVFMNEVLILQTFTKIYNGFDIIRKVYPYKKIKAKNSFEELTFQMCADVVKNIKYELVDEGNELFASNIGLYGYSQQSFEAAQNLFNIGKSIPSDEITILANKDNENNLVTYELLDKDNPLGVILGDITNCCQTLDGVARSCVEYGLSKRNSKFMVFRSKNVVVGQAWVWYDEVTHRICLDNIEVPSAIIKKDLDKEEFKCAFIECLKRCVKGFLTAMEEKGLQVESITIGAGYNDIDSLLHEFEYITNQPKLSEYIGYSDASNQYVLFKR